MEIDYNSIGFKCGLEIHQQLAGRKLFCNCPVIDFDETDVRFERKIRAVAGESGMIDISAEFEMAKDKRFIYESSSVATCLLEYDEEPPREINLTALDTALTVALLLNANIIDEIQVMRKIVVDGSNVAGFQRTCLIAINGSIKTSKGIVNIPTICLEEESAQRIEEKDDYVRYNLNRLGIPLIEIATSTDIVDSEHAKETAGIIGMVLRSTEKVVRGIGSIRQDVNISVNNSARTEIKGFQDLRAIPRVIDYEIKRQLELIKKGEKLKEEVRKSEQDFTTTFLRPMPGSARLYPETDILPIRITEQHILNLKAELPKLITERVEELEKKYLIANDIAREILSEGKLDTFERLVERFVNLEPRIIAHTIIIIPKEIKTRFKHDGERLSDRDFEFVLGYLNSGKISREAIIELLVCILKGEEIDITKYEQISDVELESAIRELIIEKKNLSIGVYMGILMNKYRGKVEGKRVMETLKKYIKQ